MNIKLSLFLVLALLSMKGVAQEFSQEKVCQHFAVELAEIVREGKTKGIPPQTMLDSMEKDYLDIKGQGKIDGAMELWTWVVNRSYSSEKALPELQMETYEECLAFDLNKEKLQKGLNLPDVDLNYSNDKWEVVVDKDDFTGNKSCSVYTQFMQADDGLYTRSLTVPVNGVLLNSQGDFVESNYVVQVGLAANIKSGLQILVDNQAVSIDVDREQAIQSMLRGRHLQVRYSFSLYNTPMIERHSISLDGFDAAWAQARSSCE